MDKCIGWTFASVVVATAFICPAVRAQFDHQDLLTEYAREMTKLPPLVLRTEFRSLTTPETLQARFQEYADERLQELARVPAEQRESFRKELNLPEGPNAIDDFFAERDQATLAYYADLQKTRGIFEFYAGNITEIRRYSSEDDVLRTLQFGVEQPKLFGAKQDVWVIREFSEKQKQTQISSESRVSLPGMLPLGALRGVSHRTIDPKFSSGFEWFWESSPQISFWTQDGENEVYIKQQPGDSASWLVASFDAIEQSIVPQWIAKVFLPEQDGLDNQIYPVIREAVSKLSSGESVTFPEQMFLRQITLFEQRTTLADFEGYPLSIRQFIPIERKLLEQGSLAQATLLEFILQVTDVVVQPDPRDALVIEVGDSYYDYDRSIGWIIGQGKPQTPVTRSRARLFLWIASISLVVFAGIRRFRCR